jgi:hypothetical protein
VRCPSSQTSSAGSLTINDCSCPAGEGAATQTSSVCSSCGPGTYSTGPVSQQRAAQEDGLVVWASPRQTQLRACAACPQGTTSPAGATSLQQCVCRKYSLLECSAGWFLACRRGVAMLLQLGTCQCFKVNPLPLSDAVAAGHLSMLQGQPSASV